jgi:hypothetical protein
VVDIYWRPGGASSYIQRIAFQKNDFFFARFKVFTALWLKIQTFWDVTLYRLLNSCRGIAGSRYLNLKDQADKENCSTMTVKPLRFFQASVTLPVDTA